MLTKLNIKRIMAMKSNKVVDYPIWGGYDRKAPDSGSSPVDPPVQDVEYDYFEVPDTFFNSMGTQFPQPFAMYPGMAYAGVEEDTGRKVLTEGVGMFVYSQSPFAGVSALLKIPRVYVAMKAKVVMSQTVEGNSFGEWMESYAQEESNPEVLSKYQEFLAYSITEGEFNQKLQELHAWYNS